MRAALPFLFAALALARMSVGSPLPLVVAVPATTLAPHVQDWRLVDSVIARGGTGAYDSKRNRTVAIGSAGDTREWDGTRWLHRPLPPVPGFAYLQAFDSSRGVTVALFQGITGPIQTWECDGAAWTLRSTPVAPPQVIGAAIAFDSVRGRTVLFGGGMNPGNATWEWDGLAWQQRFPASLPGIRSAAAMAFDSARARTVLFGGHVVSGFSVIPFNDTWEWDGTNWVQRVPAVVPSARSGHRLAYDSVRQRTVMFGASQLATAETWEYDGTTWVQRFGPMPALRSFPGFVYDSARGRTVLWGGITTISDTWEWDGSTWLSRAQSPAPASRVVPATAYSANRDRLVLFGGYLGGGNSAETWEWDGGTWVLRLPLLSPRGRYQHSMWADGTNVFVFGGGLPTSPYGNDTWRFDGTTWASMPSPVLPPARHSAAVAFDPTNGGALLFGGTQPGAVLNHYGDTWRWTPAGWIPVVTSTAPSPRSNAAIATDPLRQRVVLWGGNGVNGATDDTWEWDGVAWQLQNPLHRPPISSFRSMVFEPTSGAVVLMRATLGQVGWAVDSWSWIGGDWWPLSTPTKVAAAAQISATAAPGRIRMFDSERLWELTAHSPLVSVYGASCPAAGPHLFVDAWPRPGAVDFGLATVGHAANAAVFVVVGTASASSPVGNCTLLVQPGGPLVALTSDAAGRSALAVPLAPLPALVGLRAFAQAWSIGANGALATNGVEVTIGM